MNLMGWLINFPKAGFPQRKAILPYEWAGVKPDLLTWPGSGPVPNNPPALRRLRPPTEMARKAVS